MLTRLILLWLLLANHSARADRHRTWPSLSCFDIRCISPTHGDERASHIYVNHCEPIALRPPDQKHRGCDFGKQLGPSIIDHAPLYFTILFVNFSFDHTLLLRYFSLYPDPDAVLSPKACLVNTYYNVFRPIRLLLFGLYATGLYMVHKYGSIGILQIQQATGTKKSSCEKMDNEKESVN